MKIPQQTSIPQSSRHTEHHGQKDQDELMPNRLSAKKEGGPEMQLEDVEPSTMLKNQDDIAHELLGQAVSYLFYFFHPIRFLFLHVCILIIFVS